MKDYICQKNSQFMLDLKDYYGTLFFEKTEGSE